MTARTTCLAAATLLTLLISSAASAQVTSKQAKLALSAYRAKSLPASVSASQKEALDGIVGLLKKNNVSAATVEWQQFCDIYVTEATAPDVPQIESWVLNEGYVKTKQDLEEAIEKLEVKLATVGDDDQLANVDLQNMLQKQQAQLQTMSQIAKQLHDTSTAVIRKLGG